MLPGGGKKADPRASQKTAARPAAQASLTPGEREGSAGKGSKIREKTCINGECMFKNDLFAELHTHKTTNKTRKIAVLGSSNSAVCF